MGEVMTAHVLQLGDSFRTEFSVPEVARLAGISDEEARRRCADGVYPGAFKRGRRWRIPASALTSAGSA